MGGATGIAGAGVAGLFTAWYLSRSGAAVTVFDKGEPGRGCSWDAAGMLAPTNELEFTELDLLQAGLASRALYTDEVEKELGMALLDRQGTLEVALEADDIPYLRRLYAFQQEQGLEVEWLEGDRIREMEPFLALHIPAAIWSPGDIQVDNRRLVEALTKSCEARGVKFVRNTEVLGWQADGDRVQLRTVNGHHNFDKLVVCGGVGGFPEQKFPYKIYPVRGEMLSLVPPETPFLRKVVRIRNRVLGNAYLVPKAGRILLGSTAEEKDSGPRNTAGGLLDILRKCYAAVPGIYELDIQESWTGYRPASLSRQPILDQEPDKPVYHLNGLYRHGILLGPVCGRAMARLVQTGERDPLIEDFRLPDPIFN